MPAYAQTGPTEGQRVYPAAFFVTFSPANALEIVNRIPGFVLEEVDEEIRGFSQAAGNVVINGQRPITKSETIDVILSRIPANRVLRAEVGSGEHFGSEYSTKAQVLNLVLSDAGGIAGTVEASLRRDFTGRYFPAGSASALLKQGRSTYNLSAALTNEQSSEKGTDIITTLPGAALRESRVKVNRIKEPSASLAASWAFDDGDNRTAHLNGQFSRTRFALDQSNAVTPIGAPTRDDILTQRYNRRDFEIGGDVTRPLAGGGIKLIGLVSRRHRDNDDVVLLRPGGITAGGSEQSVEDDKEESLARLVWNRADLRGWSVELGAEEVFNKLDSDVGLFTVAANGTRSRIDLPIDQAVVREKRTEIFFNAGRPLTARLRLDLGLTYEMSRLTVRGDARAKRSLSFLKPKGTLDWRPRGGWHAQLSLSRTVAQLQFEDFISSATLSSGQVEGGNADLVPQRAWELLATIERPILGNGLLKIELGHNRISKLQDRVPTPEGFDAPGNLGNATQWIARAKVDAPLGQFGVKGGRLTIYGSYVGSSVKDPYTLRNRRFSENRAFLYEVEFRQDLGQFAWGVDVEGVTRSTVFRRDELDSFSEQPTVKAFAEFRPSAQTTLSFTLDNLLQAKVSRRRTFFTPDRTDRNAFLQEVRSRNRHVLPMAKLKHSFG
ncbi:MAG: TonB-dependent receptor [Rhizorhabdus sp.]